MLAWELSEIMIRGEWDRTEWMAKPGCARPCSSDRPSKSWPRPCNVYGNSGKCSIRFTSADLSCLTAVATPRTRCNASFAVSCACFCFFWTSKRITCIVMNYSPLYVPRLGQCTTTCKFQPYLGDKTGLVKACTVQACQDCAKCGDYTDSAVD